MSLKNWFKLVKDAIIDTRIQANKSYAEYIDAFNEVSLLESKKYNFPNQELENALGKEICEIKYCPEDIISPLQEHSPETIAHACPHFNGEKCTKTDCDAKAANHKYFDALYASQCAEKAHKDAWRRVFGIRCK